MTAEGDTMQNAKQEMKIWTLGGDAVEKKEHTYEEALDIAGNGRYNLGLLSTLSLSLLATGMDMFGISVIVAGASCDLNLDLQQKSILLAASFFGAIIMAYPWGYIADTKGRKWCLQVAMTVSFIASFISTFSVHWLMIAVLKVISAGFCSCSQSITYALAGESVNTKLRNKYVMIMTSFFMMTPASYFIIGFWILNYSFSYNLGFMIFTPWRLLTLILCLPLGICAASLPFFYESPKFLINQGKVEQGMAYLEQIWRRNNPDMAGQSFPVKKIVLIEDGNAKKIDSSFFRSLWEQTAPLFKPPLLKYSLNLYYIIGVLFCVNNSVTMWFPSVTAAFFDGINSSSQNQTEGLCVMISLQSSMSHGDALCTSDLDYRTTVTTILLSVGFASLNFVLSSFTAYKKSIMYFFLLLSCASGILAVTIPSNIISFIGLALILSCALGIGLAVTYIIDLFPTSYRGMASCLSVMVARGSALAGVTLIGQFINTSCTMTISVCSGLIFSAAVVTFFLPSDKPKKAV